METRNPAPAGPSTGEYLAGLQKCLKQMRCDAVLYEDSAFKPDYSYSNSQLRQTFDQLAGMDMAGIPEPIRDQVASLNSTFKNTVKDIVSGEFKKENWDAPFEAIQKSIADAKANAAPDQNNAGLDQLAEKLKEVKGESLNNEIKKMHDNLIIQNNLNHEKEMLKIAMKESPYANENQSVFMAKDWRNETAYDKYSDEELQRLKDSGVAISTGADFHNGADGIYSQVDSFYKVKKRTDSEGNSHYEATYSNVPKSDVQTTGEALINCAVSIIRVWGTLSGVLPLLEGLTVALAAIGYALSGGQLRLPYSVPFTQISRIGKSVFDEREGNVSDTVKAEIDVAQRRGKERDMTIGCASSPGKQISEKDLEKVCTYIDEMKKKAGYIAGPDGTPGTITNPKQAMGLNFTTEVHDKISALLLRSGDHLNENTQDLIKSFFRSQNNNSFFAIGYDASKYKEYIYREMNNYQVAVAQMRQGLEQKIDKTASDTSTMEPLGAKQTSTISPGGVPISVISPSAPPLQSIISPSEPALSDKENHVRHLAATGLSRDIGVNPDASYQEIAKAAIEKFKEDVTKNFDEDGKLTTTAADENDCKDFHGELNRVLEHLTEGEVAALEADGQLEVYKEASERMGIEPLELGGIKIDMPEGTLGAGKKVESFSSKKLEKVEEPAPKSESGVPPASEPSSGPRMK